MILFSETSRSGSAHPAFNGRIDNDTLVLVHGGGQRSQEMRPVAEAIGPHIKCTGVDLLGHGPEPIPTGPVSMDDMADDLAARISDAGLIKPFVLGYCWGGMATLNMLTRHPGVASGAILVGTRYRWDAEAIAYGLHLGSEERLSRPGNPLVERSRRIHGSRWLEVNAFDVRMLESFREKPPIDESLLSRVRCPVMMISSKEDWLAPLGDALDFARRLPMAKHIVLGGSLHPFTALPLEVIADRTVHFCSKVTQLAMKTRQSVR